MKVQFRSIDPEGRRMRDRATERMQRALRRLSSFVSRVKLRLEDTDGPGQGVDKRVQVRAVLPDGQVARVDARARNWPQAVDLAVADLRRRLVQQLRRVIVAAPAPAGAAVPIRQRPPLRVPLDRRPMPR
jgi:ribosome-associated translation inhibitor RaiA